MREGPPGSPGSPLAGIRVLEYAPGVTEVGAGTAASLPGALLRDFGAEVTRVCTEPMSLDAGVQPCRSLQRGKAIAEENDPRRIAGLAAQADVVFFAGEERHVESAGLGYHELSRMNPRLIHSRVRPSRDGRGAIPDFELLLHARMGLLSQLPGRRPGPVFLDLGLAAAGAAAQAAAGALALLYQRERTGRGGWCETSLYDGLLAVLPLLIGRAERPTPATRSLWESSDAIPSLSFRCADGEYLQLWLGAAGAYEEFLARIGDSPTEHGYAADRVSGALAARSALWADVIARHPRRFWLDDLVGRKFGCEPILRPGEILADPQVRSAGLAVTVADSDRGPITLTGPVGSVMPAARVPGRTTSLAGESPSAVVPAGPLSGVCVLDLSAFGAGPFAARILADLGADVIKIEPTAGDLHRHVQPMFSVVQRGKRAIALNLKSPDASEVLARLFAWSDVVHQSSRLGRAEQLGYEEDRVRSTNPDVVYVHATGWGLSGDRAYLPTNDQMMQALSGIEASAGGPGLEPMLIPGAPVDKFSGWLTACSIMAGLFARSRLGTGQTVVTSLLGAALTLKPGAFLCRDGTAVDGPTVDAGLTGYGAVYRIYRAGDGQWLALVIPDGATWQRFRSAMQEEGLPADPPALRSGDTTPQPVEQRVERLFASRPAREWIDALRAHEVPVELVDEPDRPEFIRAVIDDPVNRQLARTAWLEWGQLGRYEQVSIAPRLGPEPRDAARPFVAELGQHTREVLALLGYDTDAQGHMLDNGTVASSDAAGSGQVSRRRAPRPPEAQIG